MRRRRVIPTATRRMSAIGWVLQTPHDCRYGQWPMKFGRRGVAEPQGGK
jgi:hypothetical protein